MRRARGRAYAVIAATYDLRRYFAMILRALALLGEAQVGEYRPALRVLRIEIRCKLTAAHVMVDSTNRS
jgi:hypothetical protein